MATDSPFSQVVLLGAGVVGQAIAQAHLDAGLAVVMVDTNADVLSEVAKQFADGGFIVSQLGSFASGGEAIGLGSSASEVQRILAAYPQLSSYIGYPKHSVLMIESIVERLDVKREVLRRVQETFGERVVFASNTSSLRIEAIASDALVPGSVCGMHFFMPVKGRDMVEVVKTATTSDEVIARVCDHALSIRKPPLIVRDSPGFVVNRILWPYLNQAVAVLGAGADHRSLRDAALQIGMPMSPLELIDLIGLRTAFDAGRVAWQAFPARIEPSPILPGMIKAGLQGVAGGAGFYSCNLATEGQVNREVLTPAAQTVIEKYVRDRFDWTTEEIYQQLAIAMWIEAALVLREQLVEGADDVARALQGGLACRRSDGFWKQFEEIGCERIRAICQALGGRFKALQVPAGLLLALEGCDSPAKAIRQFVSSSGQT